MKFTITFLKISSILLSIVGALFIIPLAVAFYYGESSVYLSFIIPMLASFIFVLAVNIPTRKIKVSMNTRQTFLIVALAWIVSSIMGTIPLYCSGALPTLADAVFETVSGITTTGSTVLSEIESMEKRDTSSDQMENYQDRYQIFLAMAALLFLAEALLSERGKKRKQLAGRFS